MQNGLTFWFDQQHNICSVTLKDDDHFWLDEFDASRNFDADGGDAIAEPLYALVGEVSYFSTFLIQTRFQKLDHFAIKVCFVLQMVQLFGTVSLKLFAEIFLRFLICEEFSRFFENR